MIIEPKETTLPHDLNAEMQLIGWVLCNETGDKKLLPQILYLSVDAFYEDIHKVFW